MTDSKNRLETIVQTKARLLKELHQLEEEEKNERASEAAAAHSKIMDLLTRFNGLFSTKQRSDISAVLGLTMKTTVPKTGRQQVKPKYQLPHNGQTWSGRGRPPKAFVDWEGTVAFKEWKARNPQLKFPLFRD